MSSACDGDAIADRATQKRRLRNRATGTFVISNIGAFNLRRSNPSVPRPHSDEERATHDSHGRCRRERSETALRVVPRSLKRQAPAPIGGKDAPKPDKVIACLATPLHNFPGRESFLPGRHFAQERHGANRHGRCDAAAASCGQVCRRPVFPEYATARKRTALKRLRQNFGQQPCPPIRWLMKLRAARSSGPGIHY